MIKKVLLEIKSRYIIAGEEEVMEFEIPGNMVVHTKGCLSLRRTGLLGVDAIVWI